MFFESQSFLVGFFIVVSVFIGILVFYFKQGPKKDKHGKKINQNPNIKLSNQLNKEEEMKQNGKRMREKEKMQNKKKK